MNHSSPSVLNRIASPSRIVVVGFFVLLVVLVPIFVRAGRIFQTAQASIPQLRRQVVEADIANRIVVQQLRDAFDIVCKRIEASGTVSDDDRTWLQTWKKYDRQFLVSTRNHDAYKFLRSVTHLRMAKVSQLLGENDQAMQSYLAAIDLQTQLTNESPETKDHFLALIGSYVVAANFAGTVGMFDQEISLLKRAIDVTKDPRAEKARELLDFQYALEQRVLLLERKPEANL